MRAQNLYDLGYRNLDEIERDSEKLLSRSGKIGLKHFEDLNERFGREESARIV